MAARAGRHAGHGNPELEAAGDDAADGIDVQIEALGSAHARPQLRDHALDRGRTRRSPRARRTVRAARASPRSRARSPGGREGSRRRPAGRRSPGFRARRQIVGGTDAGAQQQRGGVVGARAHDHAPASTAVLARAPRTTAPRTRPPRTSRRSTGASPQMRSDGRARTGSRYASAAFQRIPSDDVDRRRGHARVGVEVVEIVHARNAERHRATPARRDGTARARAPPGYARACAGSPPAAAARPRLATSRRGRRPRARRSRAGCPRSRRSRCGSSSRRSSRRAGTRRGGRDSRRRWRSRAGATGEPGGIEHVARPALRRRTGRSRDRPRARGSTRPSARRAARRARRPSCPRR